MNEDSQLQTENKTLSRVRTGGGRGRGGSAGKLIFIYSDESSRLCGEFIEATQRGTKADKQVLLLTEQLQVFL